MYWPFRFSLLCCDIFSATVTTDRDKEGFTVIFFLISAVILTAIFLWMARMYRAFSYEGKRKLSKGVVEGLADYVEVPDNGSVLDVGCGSGALSIAVAKRILRQTLWV